MEEQFLMVMVTAGDDEEAQLIARSLLESRKVACANIIPGMKSLYWWQEKIDRASESLIFLKTSRRLLDEVITLVKEIHSYEVPEIIALPIIAGNEDYLKWLSGELQTETENPD